VAIAEATSQTIWLQRIVKYMGEKQNWPNLINYDIKSTIAMRKNPVHHSKTKHIAIKYHFTIKIETNMEIRLKYCLIEDQIADILTKVLSITRFEQLRAMLGVIEFASRRSIQV